MKFFLNSVTVALAALPGLCVGQGSLRVASKLVPLPEDNLETRAQAHLDGLFDDLRRRRPLHHFAVGDLDAVATKPTLLSNPHPGSGGDSDDVPDLSADSSSDTTRREKNKKLKKKLQEGMQKQMKARGLVLEKKSTSLKTRIKDKHAADEDFAGNVVDAVSQILDSTKKAVDLVNKCSGSTGCDGPEIANVVFDILGTVGAIVGMINPAIGAVIGLIVALGSFINSFFADEPVRAAPGLDAAAVEAAAFRAVMKADDTTTFAVFANFANSLRTATKFNANILKKIEDLGTNTPAHDVNKIVEGWFDQYHNFKWEGE